MKNPKQSRRTDDDWNELGRIVFSNVGSICQDAERAREQFVVEAAKNPKLALGNYAQDAVELQLRAELAKRFVDTVGIKWDGQDREAFYQLVLIELEVTQHWLVTCDEPAWSGLLLNAIDLIEHAAYRRHYQLMRKIQQKYVFYVEG
jgi:hypothetical protein